MHGYPLAYRLEQAAALCGISDDTLRRRVARGEIAAFHLGRATLISASELRRFIRELEATAAIKPTTAQ